MQFHDLVKVFGGMNSQFSTSIHSVWVITLLSMYIMESYIGHNNIVK